MSGRPAVLVIAGSDSSGGAGIVRDLRVLADFGMEAVCAICAVTSQTHGHLIGVNHIAPETVRTQIRTALESAEVRAVKIGMLGTAATVCAVADSLPRDRTIPIVLDPVLLSSSGGVLLDDAGRDEMRARLFPLASILTPNIPEAASLCGSAPAASREQRLAQARALLATGAGAVLLKGGHAADAEAVDLLLPAHGAPQWLSAARIAARCRGTGCALSTAIAAGLAGGSSLPEACREGKQYVTSMLARALEPRITRHPKAR
jgi:hydroxymethylpyrimidine/phosphomethylpyrimidine kinase